MSNVWQLSKELERIDEMIEAEAVSSGGEVSQELLAAFDQIAESFDPEATAMLIRKLRSEAEMFKEQERRFRAVSLHRDNAKKALQFAVIKILDAKGVKKEGSLSICKNGGKLPLSVEGPVAEEFIDYEPKTNTDRIRKALDDGRDLDFAEYGERGKHLRVKG